MAFDILTGKTTPTDWSRNGRGLLGTPFAYLEKLARREADAFRADLVMTAARALGIIAFLGGVTVLGYNQMKSSRDAKAKADAGWDW